MKYSILRKNVSRYADQHFDPGGLAGREQFSEKINRLKEEAIARWYIDGGQYFYEWVKENYKTWSGIYLRWDDPYLKEYYLLLGNPWAEDITVEKGAQVGYSESMIAFLSFTLSEIKIPVGAGFEAERKLRDMVPRIQATFDTIPQIVNLRKERKQTTGRKDTDYRERKVTCGGIECTFFYTSTSTKDKQKRQASSAMSSFTAWALACDEVELFPEGAIDIAKERQSACQMPTKPFRAGSTPGHEGGVIDTAIKKSGHLFQWHIACPNCGQQQYIDPFGNFLKGHLNKNEDGSVDENFIDATGRPLSWFCHEPPTDWSKISPLEKERAIATAYVGCLSCGYELTFEDLSTGQFKKRSQLGDGQNLIGGENDESLIDFCDRITKEKTAISSTIGIRLPRLVTTLFNATERINKLITTRNPSDQIQQGLGKAISIGGGKISLSRILQCIDSPLPDWCDRTPDLVVIGCDQGISAHIVVITSWWLPEDKGQEHDERWLEAHVKLDWYGDVHGFDGLENVLQKAHLMGMDSEPEVESAGNLSRRYPTLPFDELSIKEPSVYLFDQVHLKGEDFRRTERIRHGEKIQLYNLHRTAGLDWVRDRIYRKQIHLPKDLTYVAGDDHNLIVHLLSSDRRTDGTWLQTPGIPDHFFHALNFAEAAVLCSGYEPQPQGIVFGLLNKT